MGIGQSIGRHYDRKGGLISGTIARKLRGDIGYVERALEQAGEHRMTCVAVEPGAYGTQVIVLSLRAGADISTVKARGDLLAGFLGHDRVYGIKRRGGHVLLTIGPDRDFPTEREDFATVDGVDADLRVTHHEPGRDAVAELTAGYPRFAASIGDYVSLFTTAGLGVKSQVKEPNPDGSQCQVTTWTVPGFTHLHIAPTGLLVALKGVPGQTLSTYKSALPHLVTAWNAPKLSVSEPEGGTYLFSFNDVDPFDRDFRVAGPEQFDGDKGRSILGVSAHGSPLYISWKGNSGCVIGGIPGSGKTASLLPVFAGMLGQAEFHIWDGKALHDLDAMKPISRTFVSGGGIDAPTATLERIYAASKLRGDALYALTGESNFWNIPAAQRAEMGMFPVFIILDECQEYLDKSGLPKDEVAMVEANRRHIRRLIQQGRSAGIIVVLTTQKPTSESIPTIIRDNCGLRVAFKVRKKEAATAILGDIDAEADPVQIPAGTPGRFVIEDEKLGAAIGQAYYISGADLAKITSLWSPVPDQSRVAEELARRAGISVTDEPEDAAMAPTPEPEVMEPVVEPETVETQPEPEVIEPLAASEPEPPPEPAVTVAEETDNTDDPFAGLL